MEKQRPRLPNLKYERGLRGWSQAYVAQMIGSDPKTVSRWEQGSTSPSSYYLRKLVELFGKNAAELGLLAEQGSHAAIDAGELFPDLPWYEDWGEAPGSENFYGRRPELARLEQWIIVEQCRMVLVLGLGGVGKTSLVAHLAEQIKTHFQYVYWCSLQHAPPLKNVLERCLLFLGDRQTIDLPGEIDEQLLLLMMHLRKHRTLLVLDNFESVLRSGSQSGQYLENYENYGRLLQRIGETEHQSCLLLTSRERPGHIVRLEGNTFRVRSIQLAGVLQEEGRRILEHARLFGSDEAWTALIRFYAGNPLALKLISEPIQEVFGGDIADFLRRENEAVFGDIYDLLDQQFQRLTELEREILYWLAIERETTALNDIRGNIVQHVAGGALIESVHSLLRRSMIEASAHTLFTLQPVIMEYVTRRFVEQVSEEIGTGTIRLLAQYILLKAQTKEYVRESQARFILAPIMEALLATFGKTQSETKLKGMLAALRSLGHEQGGYAASNILNLLIWLHADLRGIDLSHLAFQQISFQGVTLPGVNFTHAQFADCVFTDTFGIILCVTFSPGGELLAAGTADGEIRLWHAANGMPVLTCRGHTDGVRSITFDLDGTRLISGSDDHTLRFWDIPTGRCLSILKGHSNAVRSVALSLDGNMVASGSEDQTIRLWDSGSGQCLGILQGHTDWVRSVAFSPDGQMLASGGNDQTIRLWELRTRHCHAILREHTNAIRVIAFSPVEPVLASGADDETVRLWNIDSRQCFSILRGHVYPIRSLVFSLDGKRIASGGDDETVRLWDVEMGRCLTILQGHTSRVWSVAFNPRSQVLASGSEDQTIRFWESDSGRCLHTLQGYRNLIWSIAFSPTRRIIASGSDDHFIRIWDIDTGHCRKVLHGHINRVRSVAFSPDGKLLASSSDDQTIRIWKGSTGQCLHTLTGHSHLIRSIAFSSDGSSIISGSYDRTIRFWDVHTGRCLRTLRISDNLITSVAWSPDGRFVASSGDNATVQIWDLNTETLKNRLQGHAAPIWCVAFSPLNDLLATGSDDQTGRLWESRTGRCVHTLHGHSHWVRTTAFSPDGHILASGSHDQTIRLWESGTGHCLHVLRGHHSWIWSVAFSSDGEVVGSGSDDGTIKLWNSRTGDCLQTLINERPYEGMNITKIQGLTEAQKVAIKALGAIEVDML